MMIMITTVMIMMMIMFQIDWIEKAWPCHLKEMQKDYTNKLEDMMYPKVRFVNLIALLLAII